VIWGDLEGSLFDTSLRGDARLTSLNCPVMVTSTEEGTVSATFENSLDRATVFTVRAHISHGRLTLMREVNSQIPLAPGEKRTLEWPVTAEDAAFGQLILFRVRVGPKYPIPSRDASCGILVVDLPRFTGRQLFTFALAASFLSMAAGMGLWVFANRPLRGLGQDVARAMTALIASILIGMILGILGQWLIGGLVFAINVLFVGVIIGHFVNKFGKN
jgi:hypothetical protein